MATMTEAPVSVGDWVTFREAMGWELDGPNSLGGGALTGWVVYVEGIAAWVAVAGYADLFLVFFQDLSRVRTPTYALTAGGGAAKREATNG